MPLKAELHCHIEGAAAPELVIRQAQKYGSGRLALHPGRLIRLARFHQSFLAAYDFAADLFRTEEDYARLADHYLTSLARDGAIYSEVFTSPDHATQGRAVAARPIPTRSAKAWRAPRPRPASKAA